MSERPKPKELRATPAPELQTQLNALRQELWQQRQTIKDGTLQKTHQLRVLRRQIARVHTVIRESQST